MRADRLEDVLNRDLAIVASRPAQSIRRTATGPECSRRASAIAAAGMVLSQPTSTTSAVEAVAARDELDRVGDHLAADQRGAHPRGAHRDPVGDRDRVELHRRAAGGAHALLDVRRELAQVEVARTDLDPRVGDADERLRQIGVGVARAFEHRASGRARLGSGDKGIGISGVTTEWVT